MARADLEYADLGVAGRAEPVLIGFHAQQAVEKLLKALLTAQGVNPGESHDVGRLVERLRLLDRPLADSLGPVGQLTPYAVFHRYPPRVPGEQRRIGRSQVVAHLEMARSACEVLRSSVEQRLAALQEQAAEWAESEQQTAAQPPSPEGSTEVPPN